MRTLCPNLVLYPKFQCVWLTFYLFLVFSPADLSSLRLCHGRRWLSETLVPCDKETLMGSLWIVSFIRCIHWRSFVWPPNLPLKIGKCPFPIHKYFFRHWGKQWAVTVSFYVSSSYFPVGRSARQFGLLTLGKVPYWIGIRMFFPCSQITGGKLGHALNLIIKLRDMKVIWWHHILCGQFTNLNCSRK